MYSCEHLFQAKLCKQNYSVAKQNFRYIDDINTLDNKVFEEQIPLIYPQEIYVTEKITRNSRSFFFNQISTLNRTLKQKFTTKEIILTFE